MSNRRRHNRRPPKPRNPFLMFLLSWAVKKALGRAFTCIWRSREAIGVALLEARKTVGAALALMWAVLRDSWDDYF